MKKRQSSSGGEWEIELQEPRWRRQRTSAVAVEFIICRKISGKLFN